MNELQRAVNKALETAADDKPVLRSNLDKIAHLLTGMGFKKTGSNTQTSKSRYVKRGFYDGDYPNAHYSIKTEKSVTFEDKINATRAGFDLVCDAFKKQGYRTYMRKPWTTTAAHGTKLFTFTLYKGKTIVNVTLKLTKTGSRSLLTVHATTESSQPDREYDRSGQGRGQII